MRYVDRRAAERNNTAVDVSSVKIVQRDRPTETKRQQIGLEFRWNRQSRETEAFRTLVVQSAGNQVRPQRMNGRGRIVMALEISADGIDADVRRSKRHVPVDARITADSAVGGNAFGR